VYIPEWWHHGTLSGPGPSGESGLVGVASQLVEPSGELRHLYEARTLARQEQDKQPQERQPQERQPQEKPQEDPKEQKQPQEPATSTQSSLVVKTARLLYREHIKMGTITSYVSMSELLQSLMMELYELAENKTLKSTISQLDTYREAVDIANEALKYDEASGNTHAHASKLALWRNATTESLYHIRSGKF
jgi:hypothetical protein